MSTVELCLLGMDEKLCEVKEYWNKLNDIGVYLRKTKIFERKFIGITYKKGTYPIPEDLSDFFEHYYSSFFGHEIWIRKAIPKYYQEYKLFVEQAATGKKIQADERLLQTHKEVNKIIALLPRIRELHSKYVGDVND